MQRECYDPSLKSVLYGCRGVAFIHDENLAEIPHDDFMHERAYRISEIMVDCMELILPDMKVVADPALMLRWNKDAETVFDTQGRLTIWTPKEN